MHRVDLTPVYVLHTRPFRNTSLIVELFSQVYGRVAVIAKSARGPKSRYRGQLQLFTPMLAAWFGNHELKTLMQIELNGMPLQLNQKPLFCGFYFNELLMRLLHKEDPHPKLFETYHQSLCRLEKNDAMPVVLRLFEKKLLEDLGYGLPLMREAKTNAVIHTDFFYEFIPQQGFFLVDHTQDEKHIFSGRILKNISQDDFQDTLTQASAKRLMRLALIPLLGEKPLHSRALFY
ncbi:MAG: DNA repair protein RecO [Gammaproteobacteria bacterium CG_4_10_14_0_8_um_filter_38_16]|nr:MAG: DNA repair protein RecO [Gammaproteobacteria bacterium CG_4_10_14_0_8_um_filter_38_16]PJA03355.1 MAG: DNA repair protein RecO [Gammaproteobacteria bacterium CG_4_10_14_0_2_um_filter_38_22]PJB10669.1 MAG: DNA repair protein RecO [Gammaproteobacteria bacterium CG_4_9_14_3_um_filter_38_9]